MSTTIDHVEAITPEEQVEAEALNARDHQLRLELGDIGDRRRALAEKIIIRAMQQLRWEVNGDYLDVVYSDDARALADTLRRLLDLGWHSEFAIVKHDLMLTLKLNDNRVSVQIEFAPRAPESAFANLGITVDLRRMLAEQYREQIAELGDVVSGALRDRDELTRKLQELGLPETPERTADSPTHTETP